MFLYVCKQTFHRSGIIMCYNVYKRCYVKPLAYYFNVKTKITADFNICISVPLIQFYFNEAMNILIFRSSHRRCFVRKGVLKGLRTEACNFIKKETLAQVFSCEFCEISTNTFFTEHL